MGSWRDFGDALAVTLGREYTGARGERKDFEREISQRRQLNELASELELETFSRADERAEEANLQKIGSMTTKFGNIKNVYGTDEEVQSLQRKKEYEDLKRTSLEYQVESRRIGAQEDLMDLQQRMTRGISSKEFERGRREKGTKQKSRRKDLLDTAKKIEKEFPYEDESGDINTEWMDKAGIKRKFFSSREEEGATPERYMQFIQNQTRKKLGKRQKFLSGFGSQKTLADYLGSGVSQEEERLFGSFSYDEKQRFLASKGAS